MESLRQKWQHLANELGIPETVAIVIYEELVQKYTDPCRHYHNLHHISQVLNSIEWLTDGNTGCWELRLAAWFHDIIYNPQAKDNEERSAEYTQNVLAMQHLNPALIRRVEQLILATKTHELLPDVPDAAILLDADLAILGADTANYEAYAAAIRKEYGWVPGLVYRQKRKKVLQAFLNRPHLYHTERMLIQYEAPARRNLKAEIHRLKIF